MNCLDTNDTLKRALNRARTILLGGLLLLGTALRAQNVNVTATAGTATGTYATLNAVFTAINAGTHQGVITCTVVGNTTEPSVAVPLLASGTGSSSYTSILITPSGDRVVSSAATPTASRGIIEIQGADNVTIDGDDPSTSGTRNLTFQSATSANTGVAVVRFASTSATNGATFCTIRNCIVIGSRNSTSSTITNYGIYSGTSGTGSTSTSGQSDNNDNLTIENNEVKRCYWGIYVAGTSSNVCDNLIIRNNLVGSSVAADAVANRGIYIQNTQASAGAASALVQGNDIQLTASSGSTSAANGIEVASTNAGAQILRNRIHDSYHANTGGYGMYGIHVTGSTNNAGVTIANNFIRDLYNDNWSTSISATSTDLPVGIRVSVGATGLKILSNSVSLNTPNTDPVTAGYSACLQLCVTGASGSDIRNNIFSNTQTGLAGSKYYCVVAVAGFPWGTINNNAYAGNTAINIIGWQTSDRTTLSAWQGVTAQDGASITTAAPFVSTTDLHIDTSNPNASTYNGTGASGTGITVDYDGDSRGTPPDIGGDEFILLTCSSADGGTVTPSTGSICTGGTYTMTSTGIGSGVGITNQWLVSSTPGGPYANVVGGSGANTNSYTTSALTVGTYYYILRQTCSTGPVSDDSNELTLTVYAIPSASATNNGPACAGGSVNLDGTTDIGTTYTWSGPNGFASTSEDPSVSPIVAASAGIYTFTASANGCTSTPATTTVSVNPLIYSSGATASPTTICSGSTSTLGIVAGTTAAYALSSTTYGLISGSGSALTFSSNDDGFATVALPFVFDFFGAAYSTLYVHSNGFVSFSSSQPTGTPYLETIPTAATPNNYIAICHDDLNITGTGAAVSTFVTGSSPNRVFVINWNAVKFYNSASNNGDMSGQIQLFESDMHIEVHVTSSNDPTASAHSIGIENSTGTLGYAPAGRNNVTYSFTNSTPEAWAFRPNGGSLTYSWSPSGDVVSPGSASTATNALFASTPFTVIVSDGTCSTSSGVTVNVNAAITSANITGTLEYCAGSSTTLTAVPADGVPTYTYLWSPNGETTTSIVVSAPGNYSCQVGDACSGSVNTGTATVIEKPVPTATAGSNSPVCTGDAINLSGATDIGTAFSWTGPGGYASSSQNPTIGSAALTDAGTYIFTASVNGCTSLPSNTTVSVNPSPTNVTANASATTVCAGSQVDLTSSADPVNVTVLSQNFNSAPAGWTTVNNSTGGTPANTAWTLRTSPYTPGGSWTGSMSSNDASQFYFSNNDAGGSGSSTNTELISPSMDLSNYTSATLGFWHFYRDGSTAAGVDQAYVEVSVNGGAWNAIQTYTTTQGAISAFANASLNLDAFVGNADVRVRFHYVTTAWWWGWAVDNVTVTAAQNLSYSWVSTPVYYTSNVQNPTGVTVASVPTTFTVTASTGLCSTEANVVVNADLTDTDGDLIPDCEDSCPTLAGEIGDACNDGNPNTVLDVIDGTCTCVGQACTTDLDIIFQPDGVSDIGWELRQQGTNILVQSGNGVYPASPGYSLATCLPDGCFYLVVTDDGGDGITGGGYQLRVNSSGRLIDNLRDAFGNGGFTTGSVSQVANGEGFCLPLGQDRLIFTSCDKLDWRTGPCNAEYVYANDNALVTAEYGVSNATSGYQMWWFDPNGGYSFKRFQSHSTNNGLPVSATRACGFRLNNWSGNQLAQGVLYNVKVRGRVNGTFLPWGPACRLMVDDAAAQCPRTKLMDIPGNQFLSCGEMRAVANNAYVHARPVKRMTASCSYINANRYQFRFRIIAENFVLVKTSVTGQYFVNTMGLACGKTYEVDVRASFDNGATWCAAGGAGLNDPAWGDVCLLTTSNCLTGGGQSIALQGNGVNGTLAMYPNPNRGDQLFINLSQVEDGVNTVSVDIYDGFGKRVATRTIAVQDGFVNTVLELNGELATGMYLVNITAGSTLHTERLVIQP